jgi:hypothetical protein
MGKNVTKKEEKRNLAVRLWENRGPRYMEMIDQFIMENLNSEDKGLRRDAHKLLGKVFDSNISKAPIVTKNDTPQNGALPVHLAQALNAFLAQTPNMIEVEEAELVTSDEEAIKIRNATRK